MHLNKEKVTKNPEMIGVTGGPGSGKTTFAYYLSQLLPNSYFPDMDILYHNRGYEKMMNNIGWRYVTASVTIGKNSQSPEESYKYIIELCKKEGVEIEEDIPLKEKASYSLSKLAFKYTKEYLDRETPQNCDFVILDFYLLPYLKDFCNFNHNILLDVDAPIRYNHALTRMSKNEGKSFSEAEIEARIKKMEEFENKSKVNYQLLDYDTILKNPASLMEMEEEAKKLSLSLLKKYSKEEIEDMLKREYDYCVKRVVEPSDSFAFRKYSYDALKEGFGDILMNKILFLYEENLIDKEMFDLFLENKIYAVKYYLNSNKKSLYYEDKVEKLSQELKENIMEFYKRDLIDKDKYNKLIKECKKFKKTIR